VAAADRVGETLPASHEPAVIERYETAVRYEWMFWDAAWHREAWPV
jgi:thiaminase/transcriptional activator TenA